MPNWYLKQGYKVKCLFSRLPRMVLALVCIFKTTNGVRPWRGRPWRGGGGCGSGRTTWRLVQKARCRGSRVHSCPSWAGCWLLGEPSQSSAPDLCRRSLFSFVRSWCRPRRPDPVDEVLQGGHCPWLSARPSRPPGGSCAGSLFWLVPPHGPPGQSVYFPWHQVGLTVRVRQEAPAG